MKLKYKFSVREIMGDYVLLPEGEDALKFAGMGTTNVVGAFICEKLKIDCTYDDLYSDLLNEFDAEPDVIKADLDEFLDKLRKLDLFV